MASAALLAIWIFVPSMKELSSETMKANTSLGLLAGSISLWLQRAKGEHRGRLAQALGAFVLMIGAATGAEYLFGWNLGIDEIIVSDFPTEESLRFPGRMSPITAASFCFLGSSLLALDMAPSKTRVHLSSALALPLLFIGLVTLTGYVYGVRPFYQLGPYIRIGWAGALGFLVLGLGIQAARPDRGAAQWFMREGAAGAASRRLLPAVVGVPIGFGWLELWAVRKGYVGLELGTALFAASLVVVLGVVVWANARALETADLEREKSENVFRSFFSLGLVGFRQSDTPTGRSLRVNSKMEEITGYSSDELLRMRLIEITHPEDRERDHQALAAMTDGTKPLYSLEKRLVRKDGRIVWVLVNAALVAPTADEPPTSVAAIQDITSLKESQDHLEKALRLRDAFLGIASHELRTPLAALLMQIEGILRAMRKEAELTKYAERLEKAAATGRRLEKLINDLLDVTRIGEGRLRLEPEPFDLIVLVREVVDRFRDAAAAAKTPISLLTPASLRGTWDRLRIDQVLTNLLSNAMKYGAGRPVEVSMESSGEEALVHVRDHGIGIEPNERDRIFERFERGGAAISYGGFGLGLWIAREIATASGGSLQVDSAPNEGARFTLHLPLGPADAER
jgi:PAS domain S-box-containing protein